MKRIIPTLLLIIFLLVGVSTFGVSLVAAGDTPYTPPTVYDWLNNNTSHSGSHVQNYSVDTPQRYFSGGLLGTQSVQDALNNTSDNEEETIERTLYEVYDADFETYPTTDVYDRWNEHNSYEYIRQPLLPEFKKNKAKSTTPVGAHLNPGQKSIRDAWTGIYSVQPSVHAYYESPDENDDSEYYDVNRHLSGDTLTVYAIANSNVGTVPLTEISGVPIGDYSDSINIGGTIRSEYSFDRFERESTLYITSTDACSNKCQVATDSHFNHVAKFEDVDITDYVDKGEQYEIRVETDQIIHYNVDEDERKSERVERECGERETAPCYERNWYWDDHDTTGSSHLLTTNDTQNLTRPKGFNQNENTVNNNVRYERGVYPNGSTELYINTTDMDGLETADPVWRRIEFGDDYVLSPWRIWSSQNTSWKWGYPNSDSDEPVYDESSCVRCRNTQTGNDRELLSARPLGFHTAPLEQGLKTSPGLSYRQEEQRVNPIGGSDITYTRVGGERYESPQLLRSKTCRIEYPEHTDEEEASFCGWSFVGAGNSIQSIGLPPYMSVDSYGDWRAYSGLFIMSPASQSETDTIEMHGLMMGDSVDVESDRTVDIVETELNARKIDSNIDEADDEDQAWVEIELTLYNDETDSPINTHGEGANYIQVENAEVTGDGQYSSSQVQTNDSGKVTVRVYDVKDEGINAAFYSEHWTNIDEDETAYAQSNLQDDVSVAALSMNRYLQYLIAIIGMIYIFTSIAVYFMNIINVETTVSKQWEHLFPDGIYKIILWSIILFFVLSLLN